MESGPETGDARPWKIAFVCFSVGDGVTGKGNINVYFLVPNEAFII